MAVAESSKAGGYLGIRHVALPTRDLPKAVEFYTTVLGFKSYETGDRDWAMVRQGGTSLSLLLMPATAPLGGGRAKHPSHFGWVLSSREAVDEAHQKFLAELGAWGISPPGAKVRHRDDSYGFYFKDPDGNQLEAIFIPHASPTDLHALQNDAVLVVAHGSRDELWKKPLETLLTTLKRHLPKIPCTIAFLELASPEVSQVVDDLLTGDKKIKTIWIVPAFLSSGGHVTRDLPRVVSLASRNHPGVEFKVQPALGEHAWVQEAMAAAIVEGLTAQL